MRCRLDGVLRQLSTPPRAFCCTLAALGVLCGARPLASATTSAAPIDRMAAMAPTAYDGRMSTAGRRSSLDLGPESVRFAGRAPCVQARADVSSAAASRAPTGLDRVERTKRLELVNRPTSF